MSQLYRHFDVSGKLLYVGISLSAVNRLGQHKDHAHWFGRIKRVEIERFDSRELAILAEKAAVRLELPECNIQLKKTVREIEAENKLLAREKRIKASKSNLTGMVVRFEATYTVDSLSELIGMTKRELLSHIEAGTVRVFEVDGKKSGKWPVKKQMRISGWDVIDFVEHMAESRAKNGETK